MLIFPYSTDAPIYHWPIATVVLIVINFYLFMALFMGALAQEQTAMLDPAALQQSVKHQVDEQIAQATGEHDHADSEDEADDAAAGEPTSDEEEAQAWEGTIDPDLSHLAAGFANPYETAIEPYILHYGQGLRPLEWLTSNFMHQDFFHVLGNMFGLWGLGLIIEGKIGWWRFLLLYLGIGVVQSGMEQTLMLGASGGGSLGASAIIFGMIAIAVLWAPKNDLYCVGWWGFRGGMFELNITTYAAIMILLEIVMLILTKFSFSAALLHLMGAVLGAGVGILMLKMRWVDCESWDLFSCWKEQQGVKDYWAPDPKKLKQQAEADLVEQSPDDRRKMALTQIQQLVEQGQPKLAWTAHQRMGSKLPGWELPAGDFRKLIAAFQKQNLWSDSIPLMVEYLSKHSERTAQVRLNLAKILIEHEKRPAQALKVMAKIPAGELDEKLRQARTQLETAAHRLQEDGEVEMLTEDW